MREPLRLALIWHFHQPDYDDPVTSAPSMPWTRLHALADYADMAAHLERHPRVRATLNVVPSLLDQLVALADGTAPPDPFLRIARKPAASLTAEERVFLVARFFSLNREVMGAGLRRLHELHALRGDAPFAEIGADQVSRFDDQALTDLQVLFHLAWSGPLLRADPLVAGLRAKGRSFTEAEKDALLARQQSFLGEVLPRWRGLAASGRVELSVTPYYHPILPLLCDTDSAREALPEIRLPEARFRHPEDADLQLREGIAAFRRVLGRDPSGGWPSEGAISDEALARMAEAGYRWAASDEDVLFASLDDGGRKPERLYRPWKPARGPVLLFRDHDLSDRIGFTYATRSPDDAARDFVGRLLHLRDELPDDGVPYVVSVILDGENAWEHYPGHAAPFFDALYGALADEPRIATVTASEAADPAHAAPLPRVVAGSWIYRNLATWVGHPEKNRAWTLLAAARDAVGAARGAPRWDDPAWRAVLAAEGSDWFWWYGDDHPTAFGAEFDAGFRGKLRAAYLAAGRTPPAALDEPIRKGPARGITPPAGPVRATIDGRVGDYFEWRAAGHVLCVHGAMHASVRLARDMFYGTDGASLFVRVDPIEPGALDGARVTLRTDESSAPAASVVAGSSEGRMVSALDRVLELSMPLPASRSRVRFAIELATPAGATQRLPVDGFAELMRPEDDPSRWDWSA